MGIKFFVIFGTLDFFCRLICSELGIEKFYGTSLEVNGDCCTGKWRGMILEGKEKTDLIQRLATENNIALANSYAYGDSNADVVFLSAVGHPVAVNPDKRLMKIARLKKWEVLAD